jgi:hypothetical protein
MARDPRWPPRDPFKCVKCPKSSLTHSSSSKVRCCRDGWWRPSEEEELVYSSWRQLSCYKQAATCWSTQSVANSYTRKIKNSGSLRERRQIQIQCPLFFCKRRQTPASHEVWTGHWASGKGSNVITRRKALSVIIRERGRWNLSVAHIHVLWSFRTRTLSRTNWRRDAVKEKVEIATSIRECLS